MIGILRIAVSDLFFCFAFLDSHAACFFHSATAAWATCSSLDILSMGRISLGNWRITHEDPGMPAWAGPFILSKVAEGNA